MRVSFFLSRNSTRITLRESHNEDEVDGDESEQVAHDHPVNHHDERSDRLEAPAEEQKVRRRRQHHHDRQHVFDLVRAGISQKRKRQQDAAREQEHHARRCRRLKNRARDVLEYKSIRSHSTQFMIRHDRGIIRLEIRELLKQKPLVMKI